MNEGLRAVLRPFPKNNFSRDRRVELEEQVAGKICSACSTKPTVANIKGEHVLRCGCYPRPPALRKPPTQKQRIAERLGEMMNEHLPALREMMTPAVTGVESAAPMTIEQFKTRQELVKYVVSEMQEGVHFGVIPGTQDRSLWEPGAEYLRAAFNISWSHDVLEEVEDFQGHEYRYKIHAYQLLGPDIKGPGWTATAWSRERKFWCSNRVCPDRCEGDHGPRGMEAAMLPHNVQDRALKRAFVAMIRNVTGTTGYFKQALDAGEAEGTGADGHLTVCPIHKIKFYENRIGWAHVIKGEVGPRGGKVYCNRDDVEAGLKESGGELPPETVPAEAPANKNYIDELEEDSVPRDKGVLYDRCHKRWGKSKAEVNGVLNVGSADEIKDLEWAWHTVLAFWGPEKPSEESQAEGAEEPVAVEGRGGRSALAHMT